MEEKEHCIVLQHFCFHYPGSRVVVSGFLLSCAFCHSHLHFIRVRGDDQGPICDHIFIWLGDQDPWTRRGNREQHGAAAVASTACSSAQLSSAWSTAQHSIVHTCITVMANGDCMGKGGGGILASWHHGSEQHCTNVERALMHEDSRRAGHIYLYIHTYTLHIVKVAVLE